MRAQYHNDRRFRRATLRQMSRRYQSAVYRETAGIVSGTGHVIVRAIIIGLLCLILLAG